MAVFQVKPSQKPHNNFYAYYRKDLTRIRYKRKTPPAVTIYRGNFAPKKFTGKEQDQETGLYYFGARYLDPKTSRWLSTDPALGDYLPVAPNNDDAKKHNQNLPGMGGVFNTVNLHVYHYAGNNPVKYVDPDGRSDVPETEVQENFENWLKTCDSKYYKVAQEIKKYMENQAVMGERPTNEQITQEAEKALWGQKIYAIVGTVAVGLRNLMPGRFNTGQSVSIRKSLQFSQGKTNHVFGDAGHKMEPFLKSFGGDKNVALNAINNATQAQINKHGILNATFDSVNSPIIVKVNGYTLNVGGRVIDGVFRIGTAYIK